MGYQTGWFSWLLVVLMSTWAGCRACDDEPQPAASNQAVEPAKHTAAKAAKETEAQEPAAKSPKQETDQDRHPTTYRKVDIRPGAVVDMAKRPRDKEALKRLSRRLGKKTQLPSTTEPASSDRPGSKDRARPR